MSKVPAKMRLGKKLDDDAANEVLNMLNSTYEDIAPALNNKTDMVILARDPVATDDKSDLGTIWLNSSTGAKFILTATTPTWTAF